MFLNSYFLYLSLYAAVTILGIVVNRLFFTLLLLDIIERSQILQNVIKAVSMNAYQLFMTGLLGLVIMFIYVRPNKLLGKELSFSFSSTDK